MDADFYHQTGTCKVNKCDNKISDKRHTKNWRHGYFFFFFFFITVVFKKTILVLQQSHLRWHCTDYSTLFLDFFVVVGCGCDNIMTQPQIFFSTARCLALSGPPSRNSHLVVSRSRAVFCRIWSTKQLGGWAVIWSQQSGINVPIFG